MAVDVEDVGGVRFHQQALATGIEVLARVDQRPVGRVFQHPEPGIVGAQDRIFDPEQLMAGIADGGKLHQRFLGAPRLVGVDHE